MRFSLAPETSAGLEQQFFPCEVIGTFSDCGKKPSKKKGGAAVRINQDRAVVACVGEERSEGTLLLAVFDVRATPRPAAAAPPTAAPPRRCRHRARPHHCLPASQGHGEHGHMVSHRAQRLLVEHLRSDEGVDDPDVGIHLARAEKKRV